MAVENPQSRNRTFCWRFWATGGSPKKQLYKMADWAADLERTAGNSFKKN